MFVVPLPFYLIVFTCISMITSKHPPLPLTIGISLEENGLGLQQQNNPHWVWTLGSLGILGAQELIGLVHRLESVLWTGWREGEREGGGERRG